MTLQDSLTEELPIRHRLALSYAPAAARAPTLALLALDTRLAAILRAAKEPMLAQLRLTWWREQLLADPASWPTGDPLLAILRSWGARRDTLAGLTEGWEGLTAAAPLPAEALAGLAHARGAAFADLAEVVGMPGDRKDALRLGTDWGLADLASHLGDPEEQATARSLLEHRDWRGIRLSRAMRPLVVLHGMAARGLRRGAGNDRMSPGDLIAAMRVGLLGV